MKREYSYGNTDMLLAAKTISKAFLESNKELSKYREDWTLEYAQKLVDKIDYGIRKYIYTDPKRELRAVSSKLYTAVETTLKDLSAIRVQIVNDFPEESDAILRMIGFKEAYQGGKIQNSQPSLIKLLMALEKEITPAMRKKILSRGMRPEHLDRLKGRADLLKELNASQEDLKNSTKYIKVEAQVYLNEIYVEVIKICKIAYRIFHDDPIMRDRFSFSKTIRNMINKREAKPDDKKEKDQKGDEEKNNDELKDTNKSEAKDPETKTISNWT